MTFVHSKRCLANVHPAPEVSCMVYKLLQEPLQNSCYTRNHWVLHPNKSPPIFGLASRVLFFVHEWRSPGLTIYPQPNEKRWLFLRAISTFRSPRNPKRKTVGIFIFLLAINSLPDEVRNYQLSSSSKLSKIAQPQLLKIPIWWHFWWLQKSQPAWFLHHQNHHHLV